MRFVNKKGYALALSVITMIILTILGIGLYSSVEHVVKEVKLIETEHIKGHYAAFSALRYATILLQDPDTLLGGGDSVEIYLWASGNHTQFASNIGLSANHDVKLEITKITNSLDPRYGEYRVSATYYYY